MRILLYEFVTGGGWSGHSCQAPPEGLLAEGAAMLMALAADFHSAGVSLNVMLDCRHRDSLRPKGTIHEVDTTRDEQRALTRLSAVADWSVIIAPEFCGHLRTRCRAVEDAGGRLLGPSSCVVALASDKQATAEHLAAAGMSVPPGVALAPGDPWPSDFAYPAVLKPRDGAGSQGIEWHQRAPTLRRCAESHSRWETFCPGTPASVACLCGPRRIVPLPPCRQNLSQDGRFTYLGGSLPLEEGLARRARRLAVRAIGTLDDPRGYLGVDLILGDKPSGESDVVVEINPRLTTSYVGLREHSNGNLAEAMMAIAAGHPRELSWKGEQIDFDASGRVRFREPIR